MSEDPAYWALPQELLLDPQQQNSYSYARNNPINLSDPSGLLTVVVPGTYYNKKAWSTNGNAKDFISAVGKTFGESPTILNWSGRDNIWARKDAANSLTNMIKDHDFVKGEKLNIVGHSHGGNIAILASQMVNRKIDNLVTLGTPARSDYQPNYDMIGNHVNVYNASDGVQQIGGSQIKASGIVGGVIGGLAGGLVGSLAGLIVGNAIGWGEVGSASRTFSGARNMTVPGRGSSVSAHSNLWSDLNVWSTLSRQIK
ncbi:alpha/beta fold hydrolase [Candidatus Nomurabacteria bacterium]|nr:alpha/beta fold hydrolase [Candidatus Nomurabacteria bacterium]